MLFFARSCWNLLDMPEMTYGIFGTVVHIF